MLYLKSSYLLDHQDGGGPRSHYTRPLIPEGSWKFGWMKNIHVVLHGSKIMFHAT